jgi:pyruvate ferredoxin oxidoreductase alpha subunit
MFYAAGGRFPIVMMNANRSLALPWSIFGDQSDSLALLNSGWIQVYVEDAQEALDMTIQAYRIGEDPNVLTPVMVNLDGFILTHTHEVVEVPEQDMVDEFLPPYVTINKMNFERPLNMGMSTTPQDNLEFKYQQNRAMLDAMDVIRQVDEEYAREFGRRYGGLVEEYRCDDADALLVTTGSITGTARVVVDAMRSEGKRVGLLKLRYIRPFPVKEIAAVCGKVERVGVVDKDISFGYEGTIFTNVNSALLSVEKPPHTVNFICGMGGRDVSKGDIEEMYSRMLDDSSSRRNSRVQFIGMRVEIDER